MMPGESKPGMFWRETANGFATANVYEPLGLGALQIQKNPY
jgi:hypothetical protein